MRYQNRSMPHPGVRLSVLCCRVALWAVVVGAPIVALSPWPLGFVSSAWAAAGFVDGFEDLPLMPALSQDPGSVTTFDSPYGRIIESAASGRTSRQAVLDFYAQTLPQLGWDSANNPKDPTSYRREGETLSLDVREKNGAVTVRFQVSPY